MLARVLPLLLLGLTMLGCQGPDLTNDVNTYVAQTNDVRAQLCDCILDLGNPDAMCDASLDQLAQFDADCMVSALDGHERDGQDYLDCVNAALGQYVQCVSAASCDTTSNDACTAAYNVAAGKCTQLPTGVQTEFDACMGQ